jgi:hypothetical protein
MHKKWAKGFNISLVGQPIAEKGKATDTRSSKQW